MEKQIVKMICGLLLLASCKSNPTPVSINPQHYPLPPIITVDSRLESVERVAKSLKLEWDEYDTLDGIIQFNIYSTTNALEPLVYESTVENQPYHFIADLPLKFFAVTATNIVSGLESEFGK